MAESDLDYAKATGRFGLTVGDTDDAGDNPDVIWCDEGDVEITPLITFTKVIGGTPSPFEAGNSVITATISGDDYVDGPGYLTFLGKRFVIVVDLTSEKVNPRIGPDLATHRVTFKNVKANGTRVDFPSRLVRLTKLGPDGDGVNELTRLLPVVAGTAAPIYPGPQGVGVAGASIVDGTDLELELTDGSTVNAGELPVGPGGSDPGVAGYLANPASETSEQAGEAVLDPDHPLGSAIAALIADIPTEAP